MALSESSPILSSRFDADAVGAPAVAVVWLRGEHDTSTRLALVHALEGVCNDDVDVIVDLSGVTFMDASVIGVLMRARDRLVARSLSLHVRAPSPSAQRLLAVCRIPGLEALAGPVATAQSG